MTGMVAATAASRLSGRSVCVPGVQHLGMGREERVLRGPEPGPQAVFGCPVGLARQVVLAHERVASAISSCAASTVASARVWTPSFRKIADT